MLVKAFLKIAYVLFLSQIIKYNFIMNIWQGLWESCAFLDHICPFVVFCLSYEIHNLLSIMLLNFLLLEIYLQVNFD